LVGDAAHVFPPAGGLGMNTGLQDVFSLAWRLKWNVGGGNHPHSQPQPQQESSSSSSSSPACLYTRERQPVARTNAALSVRNYQRVLNVMQACYLDPQHPTALIAGLEASAKLGVPLAWRRNTFRTLLRTALWPLGQLLVYKKDNSKSVFAKHVTHNLQKLLQSGQGLPLLFPNHEVGFGYHDDNIDEDEDEDGGGRKEENGATTADGDKDDDWSHDTWALPPKLKRGALFPHMVVQVVNHSDNNNNYYYSASSNNSSSSSSSSKKVFPRLCRLEGEQYSRNQITTRDLPAQLATPSRPCVFCILHIRQKATSSSSSWSIVKDAKHIASTLQDKLGLAIPCTPATLMILSEDENSSCGPPPPPTSTISIKNEPEGHLIMSMDKAEWQALRLLKDTNAEEENDDDIVVVIRPDGHVASMSTTGDIHKRVEETLSCLGTPSINR
jgi:hypothetical protein